MPQVSIIVPIYNVESYLKQCLHSIAAQTLADIEVLCINDGSTDSSGSMCDEFASNDPRFKVTHKQNAGYGAAVNTGLDLASGTYIGIVEPDDYIDPAMFETLFIAARSNSYPDVVKAAYWRVVNSDTANEQIVPCYYLHHVAKVGEPFKLEEDSEIAYHHPSIWSAIYSKEFLNRTDIRMKEIPGAGWADNPWMLETLTQAKSIVYIDEPLYYYREFNDGSSSNIKDPSILWQRWFEMDDYLKSNNITAPKVLDAHYSRGCYHLLILNDEFDGTTQKATPEVKAAINEMVDRMNYHAIYNSEHILPNYKDAYQKHVPKWKRALYKLH